jgi:ATP-dependent DNA ligase
MLAKLSRDLPRSGFRYEPKWDGFRALVFRDGDDVDIRSRNDKKLARYFPEIVEAARAIPCRDVVLDGEIIVVAESGLDFTALMSRLHPAASRVEKLRRETPAAFVAFDLLAVDGEDLRARPLAERRARLEMLLRDHPTDLFATPQTSDPEVATEWLAVFTGRGVDGVVAKDPASVYVPGQRRMIKVKRERTADCVVAGIRLLSAQPPTIGSLLLGLHDESGSLVHLGVASQLTKERRSSFFTELAPLVTRLEGHPWEKGFGLDASPLGRLSGSAGRWDPEQMERDWIPVEPKRVCEVAYDVVDGRRLRFPARFVRWRDDRDPSSCTFEQMAG